MAYNSTHKIKKPVKKRKTKTLKKDVSFYVVGIVTVPLTPTKKYYKVCGDSYIASSHIHWLKTQKIRVLPIPYDTKDLDYYFKRIHALYLPSGGAFAGTQMEYFNVCKKLLFKAMEENNKGNYFPVWGCCMGFQQMLIIADGKDNVDTLLEKFDSFNNLFCSIKLTEEGKKTKFVNGLGKNVVRKLTKTKSTLNNHMLGISPEKFKKNRLINNFYTIVGTSVDRKGKEFVAIIEGAYYPFYGVQWHPERNSEMDALVEFFAKEVRKSKKPKTPKKVFENYKLLKYKQIDCMAYSNSLYKKCNFYWHKITSEHNTAMCNYAQLQKSAAENPELAVGGI